MLCLEGDGIMKLAAKVNQMFADRSGRRAKSLRLKDVDSQLKTRGWVDANPGVAIKVATGPINFPAKMG